MQESEHHNRSLTSALRAFAEDDAPAGASPAVEARLVSEVRSIAMTRRRRAYAAALAMAAALLIAVFVPAWRTASRLPVTAATAPVAESIATASRREVVTAFLPLMYGSLPVSDGQIVRMEVPRAALASFGLAPMDAPVGTLSGTVQADVLVGADGLARAVRFVRPVANPGQP